MTMLLPDARILSRAALKRSSSGISGVGAINDAEMQVAEDYGLSQATAAGADGTASSATTTSSGGGFWDWLGQTLTPVIQSVTPGLINYATGAGATMTAAQKAAAQAQADANRKTLLWMGVVVLGGAFLLIRVHKSSSRRRPSRRRRRR